MAICLCAGILSDTLNLTSPTTARADREMLEWLTGIARIDAKTVSYTHLDVYKRQNGDRLTLPSPLPAPSTPVTIESPWNTVFAYNYCTLSYTCLLYTSRCV